MANDVQPRKRRPLRLCVAGRVSRVVKAYLSSIRSPEGVLTKIYRKNIWGGEAGSIHYGGGTHDGSVTAADLDMFAMPADDVVLVLNASGNSIAGGADAGRIQTALYTPGRRVAE